MPLLVARPPQEGLCLWPPGRLWGDPLTPRDQGVCQDWGGSYSSLRSSRCSRSRSLKQPSDAMLSRTSGSSSPFDGRLRMATRRPGAGSRHGSGSCFPPLGRRRIVGNRASPMSLKAEAPGSPVPACSFIGNPRVRAPAHLHLRSRSPDPQPLLIQDPWHPAP